MRTAPRRSIDAAIASPAANTTRRRSRAMTIATASSPSPINGSHVERPSINPSTFCTLPRSADWKIVNVASTSGIRSAMAKPASVSWS